MWRALLDRGHHVELMTTDRDGRGSLKLPIGHPVGWRGVPTMFIRAHWLQAYAASVGLGSVLRQRIAEFDAVHVHSLYLLHTLETGHWCRRALPAILDVVPDTAYPVVGKGPRESLLRTLAAETGVSDSVVFCGAVPDRELAAYYSACDVFVLPSRIVDRDIEGFDTTFTEAEACGEPSIGGPTGGIVEAVVDGKTGLLVDPDSPDEIARATISLLTDPDLASRIGAAAKRRVTADFQYAQIAKNLLDRALTDPHESFARLSDEISS